MPEREKPDLSEYIDDSDGIEAALYKYADEITDHTEIDMQCDGVIAFLNDKVADSMRYVSYSWDELIAYWRDFGKPDRDEMLGALETFVENFREMCSEEDQREMDAARERMTNV